MSSGTLRFIWAQCLSIQLSLWGFYLFWSLESCSSNALGNIRAKYAYIVCCCSFLSNLQLTMWCLMRRYVQSSFGWDPATKQKELFHNLSRFIVAYKQTSEKCHSGDQDRSASQCVAGFTMFRFEHEDEDDMVYWCVQWFHYLVASNLTTVFAKLRAPGVYNRSEARLRQTIYASIRVYMRGLGDVKDHTHCLERYDLDVTRCRSD